MSFGFLARWRSRDEARDGFDALHHVLVTVRSFPTVTLYRVSKTYFFERIGYFATLYLSPPTTERKLLLFMHLLLSRFAVVESCTCATRKH